MLNFPATSKIWGKLADTDPPHDLADQHPQIYDHIKISPIPLQWNWDAEFPDQIRDLSLYPQNMDRDAEFIKPY